MKLSMPSILQSVMALDSINDHIMSHVVVCFKNLGAEDKEVAQPSRLRTTVPEDLLLVFSIRQLRIS